MAHTHVHSKMGSDSNSELPMYSKREQTSRRFFRFFDCILANDNCIKGMQRVHVKLLNSFRELTNWQSHLIFSGFRLIYLKCQIMDGSFLSMMRTSFHTIAV